MPITLSILLLVSLLGSLVGGFVGAAVITAHYQRKSFAHKRWHRRQLRELEELRLQEDREAQAAVTKMIESATTVRPEYLVLSEGGQT